MTFKAGTKVGTYEILGDAIGAGGMGQVYRARDTQLDRIVAIKVLAEELSHRPEFRDRFEREARTISNLSHPHICTVHHIGHQDGVDYLVMEYLEGETVASRLARGPIPAAEAIRIATEIGDALDKAHRQGFVHRDVKPGNVMLTKNGAKLLDFGLAKLRASEAPVAVSATAMPTGPNNLTAAGTILGTLQYMSPEQLEGKEADSRSDIFSFGAMLYEMLTGRKAFQGKTQVSLMAAILEHDPPSVSSIQPIVPAALNNIVRDCLAKDPEDRWQTARDIVRQLKTAERQSDSPAAITTRTSVRWRERLAWGLTAGISVVIAVVLGGRAALREDAAPPVVRFDVTPPPGGFFPGANNVSRFAVSPDGRYLAFEASPGAGKPFQLWIRRLDSTEAQPLPLTATNDVALQQPFWSPDGRYIAFFDEPEGKLKKIDIQGGAAQTLCDLPSNQFGGTWNAEGTILMATAGTNGVRRVSANGGVPTQVTTLDTSQHETMHLWPYFLPDGRHFLYHVQTATPDRGVYVGSLDSKDHKMLVQSEYMAQFAPPDFLLYVRGQSLLAQKLDLKTFERIGEPVLIAESIRGTTNGRAGFSVSNTGVIVYSGGAATVAGARQLLWIDRTGKRSGPVGAPLNANTVKLSPDGKRVAFSETMRAPDAADIWIYDTDRDLKTRLTTDPAADENPVWSPDGSRLVFSSIRDGKSALYEKPSNGAVPERLLFQAEAGVMLTPLDWSLDGRFILFAQGRDGVRGHDLWVLLDSGDRKSSPYLKTPFDEPQAALSPDGRWLAYVSDESGTYQVIVQPFPSPSAGKWQISTDGGIRPRWKRDGKEIYYQDSLNRIIAVPVKAEQNFQVGKPTPIFETQLPRGSIPFQVAIATFPYDVTADGQRFLLSLFLSDTTSNNAPLTVVFNWTSALKR